MIPQQAVRCPCSTYLERLIHGTLPLPRYNSKDDYHHHKASKPFEEFHTKLRESGIEWVSKQGQSFAESGVGYM